MKTKSKNTLKLLLCVLAITTFFINKNTFAQNLQFNQVLLVNTLDTVPDGKVWKVESAIANKLLSSCSTSNLHTIAVNGQPATLTKGNVIFDAYCGGWEGYATVTTLPIWLPEKTTLEPTANISYLSVLEFNIVP